MDAIADVLGSVRKKGVRLWSENGQLHYTASKGALTQEEIAGLRSCKDQIVAILEGATGTRTVEPKVEPRPRFDRAPLAFSQVAHWNVYRLNERHAIRQIASATRLRGRLNVTALERSFAEVIQRHDALRTRIVTLEGSPVQEISRSIPCALSVEDLTRTPERLREAEVIRITEQHVLEPINVAAAPLFGARLLRLHDDDHVLVVATEHMISDELSMHILLRDLFTAYRQVTSGHVISLPHVPVQFADYAVWQRNTLKSWIEKHGTYWSERLIRQRLRFPQDKSVQSTREGWASVSIHIGADLKMQLRDWCRIRRTTLVMSVFTAYVALVLRWCHAPEAIIQYQSNGRAGPDVENTIGYFASALYLRMGLAEDDSFVDLMKQVTEEYCRAYQHADFAYMAAQVPRPEFTRNPAFNWVPQGLGIELSDLDKSEHAIACSPVPFVHPMLEKLELDHEPVMLFYDADHQVVGDLLFPRNRYSVDTMQRFGRNFLVFIEALLKRPESRVKDVSFCE